MSMRYLSDTDKLADAKAIETRTAVEAALTAAGFDAPKSKHTETIIVKTTDGKYVASVNVRRDHHDYHPVVKATVSPDWTGHHRARIKTVNFWADRKKNFTIDPAKIVAKVLAVAAAMADYEKYEAARNTERTAHAKRLGEASAAIRALTGRPAAAGAYGDYVDSSYKKNLSSWNIHEAGNDKDGYTYSFSADLRYLSEDTLLKVLALLDKS